MKFAITLMFLYIIHYSYLLFFINFYIYIIHSYLPTLFLLVAIKSINIETYIWKV